MRSRLFEWLQHDIPFPTDLIIVLATTRDLSGTKQELLLFILYFNNIYTIYDKLVKHRHGPDFASANIATLALKNKILLNITLIMSHI
jgi:hypothetical protein